MVPWARIALGVAAFILVVSLLQFVLAINPPRQRSETTPADVGLDAQDVRFATRDGIELAGWFVPAKNHTNATIIVGHGYPFDKGDVLPGTLFLHERYNLLYYDHRSFGQSDGAITTLGLREQRDVEAAVDHALSRNDTDRVAVYGFSLSAAAAIMANDERVAAIVADSPYASLGDMVGEVYPMFPGPLKWPFVWTTDIYARVFLGAWPSQASPEDAIRHANAPVLLVHGTADDTIPPTHSKRIHANAPPGTTQLWLVDGAVHGAAHAVAGEEYERRVLAFLGEHLG